MKEYFIIALLAAIFCGCENSEENNYSEPFLKLNKELLTFNVEGGKETVKVSSNCEWKITGGSSWCIPSVTECKGNMSITFTTAENSATADLKTTFYFEFEGKLGTELVELEVIQEAIKVDDVATLMDDATFISYCYENFDLNKDGKISIMEANTAKFVEFKEETKLISVKGIEVFTNLEKIYFYKCSNLRSINLSKNTNITTIEDDTFYDCDGLTSITIPNSVTSIGKNAFYGCNGLTSVTIPNSVTSIGSYAFCYCKGLTSITIPDSVTKIGGSAFEDCDGLTSITIPDSVTKIGDYAFEDCNGLISITIGNGVTEIGYEAFAYCSSLTRVFCKCTTPPTAYSPGYSDWVAFYRNAADRKIYVPTESVDAYKAARGWKDYADAIRPYDF